MAKTLIPPPPDAEGIVRLLRAMDVQEEGRVQKNCVSGLALPVVKGEVCIYRVLQPERATLRIEMGPDALWKIGELKASCNRPAGASTHARIQTWLDAHAKAYARARAGFEELLKAKAAEAKDEKVPF